MSSPISLPPASNEPMILAKEDWPNTDHLITEDGQPVDGFYSERQMRLLAESLTASWKPGRPFIVGANVGIFYINENPAIVPDVFVSVDVKTDPDYSSKAGKSYLLWNKGKPPDIVIEVVSNAEGNELTEKRRIYAQNVRAPYYVVWDPEEYLKGERLQVFILMGRSYQPTPTAWFPELGLGLKPWQGEYAQSAGEWLRWIDGADNFLPCGEELFDLKTSAEMEADAARRKAEAATKQAEGAREQAEAARKQSEMEKQRADRMAAKLRELGLDPDQ